MAAPVAVVRLGRAGTAALCAAPGPGGLDVRGLERSDIAGITEQGRPSEAAGAVIGELCREVGAREATLVLPPGATVLKRAEVDVPDPGAVTNADIEKAVGAAQDALANEGEAFLSCRPYAYECGDGADRSDPPLGERPARLTVKVAACMAPVALLALFDRTLKGGGILLSACVPAADALAAVLLPSGEGTLVHVAREDTTAVMAQSGVVVAQARIPLGRRHLEGDLAQAHALEPAEAARMTDAVLARTSANDSAIEVVDHRLAEMADLLTTEARQAGVTFGGTVLSGLPGASASRIADAAGADLSDLPPSLRDEPVMAGAALLAMGLRGGLGRALLPSAASRSPLDWLLRRF